MTDKIIIDDRFYNIKTKEKNTKNTHYTALNLQNGERNVSKYHT